MQLAKIAIRAQCVHTDCTLQIRVLIQNRIVNSQSGSVFRAAGWNGLKAGDAQAILQPKCTIFKSLFLFGIKELGQSVAGKLVAKYLKFNCTHFKSINSHLFPIKIKPVRKYAFSNHSFSNWLYFNREEVRINRLGVHTFFIQTFCKKFASNTLA